MVLRLGTNARRTGAGGHRVFRATGQALVAILDWLTHAGQAYAAANGYVPLPAQIRQLARTTLQRITGPSGTSLLS